MTAQLWVTAVVAVLGYAATLFGTWLAGWRTDRLAREQRDRDRTDRRDSAREAYFRDFLSAARLVRLPEGTDGSTPALADLRRAAAGIELYAPELAGDLLLTALQSSERLARLRTEATWSEAVADAEQECDHAISALRQAMQADLGIAIHPFPKDPRRDHG